LKCQTKRANRHVISQDTEMNLIGAWFPYYKIPSGNQTWQWTIPHLWMMFSLKPPFLSKSVGCPATELIGPDRVGPRRPYGSPNNSEILSWKDAADMVNCPFLFHGLPNFAD
jgi:hypothetical protein